MSLKQRIAAYVPWRVKYALRLRYATHGRRFAEAFPNGELPMDAPPGSTNPLEAYFDANTEGPGIWKWRHYFSVYHKHLAKFVGCEAGILEVGIYSGGSLPMWRHYLGPQARVYGVDIEPACKAYEREGIQVFIGDQQDRSFWRSFKSQVPPLDVIIDDGGHGTDQQIATLEEMLPHMNPGGVYLCEDVHGELNGFASYAHGLALSLHDFRDVGVNPADPERRTTAKPTPYQSAIASVTSYPYLVVIERNDRPVGEFVAPKHGTLWEPFLG